MHLHWSERTADGFCRTAIILSTLVLGGVRLGLAAQYSGGMSAPPASYLPGTIQPREVLYLEVVINGYRTKLIAAFRRYADGCLTIETGDLRQLNLKAPESAVHDSGGICMERMPGVSYRYDAPSQTIYLTVEDDARVPLMLDAGGPRPAPPTADERQRISAIFNYALTANFGSDTLNSLPEYQGIGASVDGHIFSGYGNLDQSFALRFPLGDNKQDLLRLDSLWSYDDLRSLMTVAAGDFISGSLPWTRALRVGGVQIRSNFSLQPNLVTQPIPQLAGSAAVPSTVEVYANQNRTFSQDVTGGPFNISNLPLMSGPTTMQLVIRDASGKETKSEYSYYSSPLLLAPGMIAYSAEAGFARTFYGVLSDSYDSNAIGSGSVRYGLTPQVTLEGHAEGGAGLVNGGGGVNLGLGRYGVASVSVLGSDTRTGTGGQVSGAVEASLWGVKLYLASLRGLGDYQDLASVTAPKLPLSKVSGLVTAAQSGAPYKRRDQLSASFPLMFDAGSLNLSFTDAEDYDRNDYKLGSLNYSRQFFWENSTFSATAFNDFERPKSYGVYATVTFTWDRISAGSLAQGGANSGSSGGFATQSLTEEPGSFGYAVRAQEGNVSTASAAVSYRSSTMLLQAGAQQSGNSTQVSAQAEGSVAFLNGAYFANRIDNSFAVVDTGVPGVRVLHDYHPIGETGSDGSILIPSVRAHDQNGISIDPASIPVQADFDGLEQKITPAQRGGMSVHFKGNVQPASAIAVFRDSKGTFIPASSEVWVNEAKDPFVIGYDGEAYLTGLAASNTALVKRPEGTQCIASFTFTPQEGKQGRIDSVLCIPSELVSIQSKKAGGATSQVRQ